MKLKELRDNRGSSPKLMRVARGVGSGKGKTAGRGVKGQKSRRGVSINGFEGGQMPLHMRMPKRGFNPPAQKRTQWINLGVLQKAIDNKVLDAGKEINEDTLVEAGLIRRKKDGIRLLARGALKTKVNLVLTGASAWAGEAVKKAGGWVTLLTPPAEEAAA